MLLAFAALRLRGTRAAGARRSTPPRVAVLGVGLGFLLWFAGFMVIGGEWFAMWQSKTWNGRTRAFRFYVTLLAVRSSSTSGTGSSP